MITYSQHGADLNLILIEAQLSKYILNKLKSNNRDGETYFYLAEILLLDKERQTAKTYLRNAIEKGTVPSTEYFGAKAELARFGE